MQSAVFRCSAELIAQRETGAQPPVLSGPASPEKRASARLFTPGIFCVLSLLFSAYPHKKPYKWDIVYHGRRKKYTVIYRIIRYRIHHKSQIIVRTTTPNSGRKSIQIRLPRITRRSGSKNVPWSAVRFLAGHFPVHGTSQRHNGSHDCLFHAPVRRYPSRIFSALPPDSDQAVPPSSHRNHTAPPQARHHSLPP